MQLVCIARQWTVWRHHTNPSGLPSVAVKQSISERLGGGIAVERKQIDVCCSSNVRLRSPFDSQISIERSKRVAQAPALDGRTVRRWGRCTDTRVVDTNTKLDATWSVSQGPHAERQWWCGRSVLHGSQAEPSVVTSWDGLDGLLSVDPRQSVDDVGLRWTRGHLTRRWDRVGGLAYGCGGMSNVRVVRWDRVLSRWRRIDQVADWSEARCRYR